MASDGETLRALIRRTSLRPMTMGQTTNFFLNAWSLTACLAFNFENDIEGMLDFLSGESEFYPYFDAILREKVPSRFGT
jgi:hypothetical protein